MQRLLHLAQIAFFFCLGCLSTSFILVTLAYFFYVNQNHNRVVPGVLIQGVDVSGLTQNQIIRHPSLVNSVNLINSVNFDIVSSSPSATVVLKASDLNLNLNLNSVAKRALSIGRQTNNPYYNFLQIVSAWRGQINLPLEPSLDTSLLNASVNILAPRIEKPAVDAIFQFNPTAGPDQKGRVQAFTPSINGVAIDRDKIQSEILTQVEKHLFVNSPVYQSTSLPVYQTIPLYTKVLYPKLETSTADDMGLKTLLGRGESYFYDSIPGRVFNIGLGTEKVSGSLIAPGEIFSFNNSIGTISALFGFQKAYAIIKGKTVLDDGGGVCQVSTTLYRAVLNAGLPVVERAAHAYRVGFYEQGGFKPGLDATVYPPSPDFRFKNDTGNWILLQATFDKETQKLTFDIFGTNDGRKTTIDGPYILSTVAPPEPIYEDDPSLPLGQVKQVDTPHAGAKVYFKRTVIRNEETLINETVISNYIPWPARYLRGTKT